MRGALHNRCINCSWQTHTSEPRCVFSLAVFQLPLKPEMLLKRKSGQVRRIVTDRCPTLGKPDLPISVFQTDHFPYFCRAHRDSQEAIPGIKKTSLWIIVGNSRTGSRCVMAWRLRIGRDRQWLQRQYGNEQRITYYDSHADPPPRNNCWPIVYQPCRDLSLWAGCT
jgi:hypothetical protein